METGESIETRLTFNKLFTALSILDEQIDKLNVLLSDFDSLTLAEIGEAKELYKKIEFNEIYISAKLDQLKSLITDSAVLESIEIFKAWRLELSEKMEKYF